MNLPSLLNERAAQEADARLRRRSLAAEKAAERAASREALETEQINTLQAQLNKWNNVGVTNANSHDLKDPVVVPTGSQHLTTFVFSAVSLPLLLPQTNVITFRGDFEPKIYQT